jgi:hypothetical protein
MSVEVGQQYETTAAITDRTGAFVTPSQIHLDVTLPDGTATNIDGSIVTDSTGNYHADYTMTQEGLHTFTWSTTGPVTHKTDFANANIFRSVVGIDEVRQFINDDDTTRDDILRQIMASATELAEGVVGSCVQRTYTNERVPGFEKQVIRLPHTPVISVTSISSVYPGGPSWGAADLILYPDSGTIEPSSLIPFWWGPWSATYVAGRAVIPQRVQLAVKEIVFDLWAIQRSFGLDEMEPGPEETARYEQMLASYDMPPHARALLDREAMPGFA